MSTITFKTDEQTKKKFNSFCNETGLNMSVALDIFMKTVLREGCIPFDISVKKTNFETLQVFEEIENNKNMSKIFDNVSDLIEDLNA